jgi:hypothetical protein
MTLKYSDIGLDRPDEITLEAEKTRWVTPRLAFMISGTHTPFNRTGGGRGIRTPEGVHRPGCFQDSCAGRFEVLELSRSG